MQRFSNHLDAFDAAVKWRKARQKLRGSSNAIHAIGPALMRYKVWRSPKDKSL